MSDLRQGPLEGNLLDPRVPTDAPLRDLDLAAPILRAPDGSIAAPEEARVTVSAKAKATARAMDGRSSGTRSISTRKESRREPGKGL